MVIQLLLTLSALDSLLTHSKHAFLSAWHVDLTSHNHSHNSSVEVVAICRSNNADSIGQISFTVVTIPTAMLVASSYTRNPPSDPPCNAARYAQYSYAYS